ncbi:MAG: nickel pincer cofactor biosynthesis protein LarC [Anaerocolumna sp.]
MNKKTLYLECYSGISGDMTVASLIDLGADVDVLMNGLNSLNVDGYKIEISRKEKNSIDACDFNVILDIPETNHEVDETHSHDYFHEHNIEHTHDHDDSDHIHPHGHDINSMHSHDHDDHDPDHANINTHHIEQENHNNHTEHKHLHAQLKAIDDKHIHAHAHGEGHPHLHYGHHEHRNLNDINLIIDGSEITDNAKRIAKRIFYIVAVAEAKAHGKSIDEVHFHEVGAVDSIVDIVAVAICLDNLNIVEVIVSVLYEGTGHINCQHGILPVPVPAVINIAAEHNLNLHITTVKGELVTPTGAAIVAAIKTSDTLPKEFKINKIGLGVGKRNYEQASFLRAMLIEDTSANFPDNSIPDKVWVLEANIDDCTGEALSIAMDALFKNGARDVYYTPIYMKKNRPAYLLGVICNEDKIEFMEEIIFTHTTTIGIRKHETFRTKLNREIRTITTPYGDALVKLCTFKDKTFYYPECESIKKLCNESGKDYTSLYSLVQTLASQE